MKTQYQQLKAIYVRFMKVKTSAKSNLRIRTFEEILKSKTRRTFELCKKFDGS